MFMKDMWQCVKHSLRLFFFIRAKNTIYHRNIQHSSNGNNFQRAKRPTSGVRVSYTYSVFLKVSLAKRSTIMAGIRCFHILSNLCTNKLLCKDTLGYHTAWIDGHMCLLQYSKNVFHWIGLSGDETKLYIVGSSVKLLFLLKKRVE